MKSCMVFAFLLLGLVLRMHGWSFVALEQTKLGFLLVIGGSIVTLSIVMVLAAPTGP